MIDGTIRRFLDEPVHLAGMREDEPLHIPTVEEYWAATGRVLIARDFHQYTQDTPFNLHDGPPPAVLGTFVWSGFGADGQLNIDLTDYFYSAQISGELPYTNWRVRGIYRSGYTALFYTNPGTPSGTLAGLGTIGENFSVHGSGYGLQLSSEDGNLINPWPGNPSSAFFMGGPPGSPVDLWFPISFQVEVGYGGRQNAINTALRTTGSWDWPAFSAGLKTDYKQYRGWSPAWACYNGFANAPNVVAAGGCPFTGQGGYVTPDEPEDE